MSKTRALIATAALLASTPFVGTVSADAAVPTFDAKLLGVVQIDKSDPSVGYVLAQYVCDDIEAAAWHLWVSVKQNDTATHDPALEEGGSSGVAATWLQSHPVDFTCDGKRHVQRFTIDTLEQGFGEGQKGVGWVQFCLIDFGDPNEERGSDRAGVALGPLGRLGGGEAAEECRNRVAPDPRFVARRDHSEHVTAQFGVGEPLEHGDELDDCVERRLVAE